MGFHKTKQEEDAEDLGPWRCWAQDVVRVHFITSPEQMDSSVGHEPEFTYEFWPNLKIKGYEGLCVNIYVNARTLEYFLNVSYDEMQPTAQPIRRAFLDVCTEMGLLVFHETRADFVRSLDNRMDYSSWTQEYQFIRGSSSFTVYHTPAMMVPEIVRRVEPVMRFYIESIIPLDLNDPLWQVWLCVRDDGAIVGYMTSFRYWHFPVRYRYQLSQVLVFPEFSGVGIGRELMSALWRYSQAHNGVDISVEEPAAGMRASMAAVHLPMLSKLDFVSRWFTDPLSDLDITYEQCLQARDEFSIFPLHTLMAFEYVLLWRAFNSSGVSCHGLECVTPPDVDSHTYVDDDSEYDEDDEPVRDPPVAFSNLDPLELAFFVKAVKRRLVWEYQHDQSLAAVIEHGGDVLREAAEQLYRVELEKIVEGLGTLDKYMKRLTEEAYLARARLR